MKFPINQILDQNTAPTAALIATSFRSGLDPGRQLPLLRFRQTGWSSWRFPIHQALPIISGKLIQPVVDCLHRHIPQRQDLLQSHPFSDHEQNRQSPYRLFVAAHIGFFQFLFQPLDGFLLKGYSKHGTSPFAFGWEPFA